MRMTELNAELGSPCRLWRSCRVNGVRRDRWMDQGGGVNDDRSETEFMNPPLKRLFVLGPIYFQSSTVTAI